MRSTDVLDDELPRSSVSPGRDQTLAFVPRSALVSCLWVIA